MTEYGHPLLHPEIGSRVLRDTDWLESAHGTIRRLTSPLHHLSFLPTSIISAFAVPCIHHHRIATPPPRMTTGPQARLISSLFLPLDRDTAACRPKGVKFPFLEIASQQHTDSCATVGETAVGETISSSH